MELKKNFMNFSFIMLFPLLLFPSTNHSFSSNHPCNVINITDTLANSKADISRINGKIIDAETNEVIPFCNIIVGENTYVTSSNENGEFSIEIDSFPTRINITHLSYQSKEFRVENTNALIIGLHSFENQLNEVILTNSGSKKAIDLINKTINKYDATNSTPLYGRSLYRQKSKNDDQFSEFAEIIYDIKFDNDGIIDWDIFEGRYALKKETINNKNFTLLSKIFRVHQPNTDDLIFPLIRGFSKYYKVNIINIVNTENGKLATIKFTPLDKIKTPIIEANVVINTKTNDILKVRGSLKNDDIKIITLGDKDASKKNYKLNFEISYREDDAFGFVLDYININHEFDYYKENKLLSHLIASSNLSFFEYYDENPKENEKKRNRFKYRSSDWDKLDIIGYNKSFWDNNPIVKRTGIENEVIESFEKLEAFESIYINSEEQISSTGYDISNEPFIQKISNHIKKHYTENLTQKVYLHTDKNNYSKENKIYYSAYVTSENADIIFNDKEVLYIDLLNGEKILDSQVIQIINGRGYGAFAIPNNFSPGNYKIVAYTNFMKNFNPHSFFTKNIEIRDLMNIKETSEDDNKVVLSFYPEGGQIINNINNKVAYRAQDSKGNIKDIQGKIVDSEGNFIATTKSKYEGLGFFYFLPIKGKSYAIILDDNSNFPIPKALDTGYSMMVNNINSRTMTIDIRSSYDLKSNKIYLLGLMDNKKYYQGSFIFGRKDLISIEIPKNKFPSGVMQLVLVDETKKVICSRSVYIHQEDHINIEAEIDKNYTDKEIVKLKIKTNNDGLVASDISLSITKLSNDKPIDNNDNIISHFKLSSFPQDDRITKFIDKSDRISNYKLDLKMLINEPVEINWLVEPPNYQIKKFPIEQRIKITGIAKDKNGNLLIDTKLKLITKSKDRLWNYESITDKNGVFIINDFEELDSVNLEFRTYNLKDQQIFSEIKLLETEKFNYKEKLSFDEKGISASTKIKGLNNSNSAFSSEGELLKNVELKAKTEVEKKSARKSILNITPDAIIAGESINGGSNLFRALANVAGVKYVSDHYIDGGESISIRNSDGPPLWLLDGMEISGPEVVDIKNVERIEIIKSLAKSAAYGPNGVNGIIAFYYKEGVDSKYANDIKASVFSKIIYNSPTTFNYKNKNDDTLFWNPQIITDNNGYTELYFKKPSTAIKYLNVNIQAINKNGEIGYYNKIIELE